MGRKSWAAASLICLLLYGNDPVASDTLESGEAAFQRNDAALAMELLLPLAERGSARAQFLVGDMHRIGMGVPQNYPLAVKWISKAAGNGEPTAQFVLGLMYYRGTGVPQDYVLAHKWSNLSSASGSVAGSVTREALEAKMTPEQIAEAQRLAREWTKSSPE